MIEEFIVVAVVLALIWFFLKHKKAEASDTTIKNAPETAKPIKQEPKQPADKAVSPADSALQSDEKTTSTLENTPTSSESVQLATHTVEPENKPLPAQATHKIAIPTPENSLLPQDSMLKRHYLTNLRAMIASLNPQHPTDSALSRHYDTQIAANIEHCLSDEAAMDRLIGHYENDKKTLAPSLTVPVKTPQTISESPLNTETASENVAVVTPHKISKIPKDSMLKRHYLTHLYAKVEANMPQRPTDFTLRRHYNTMLENEVKKQLTQ
jgi:hypothetical protein